MPLPIRFKSLILTIATVSLFILIYSFENGKNSKFSRNDQNTGLKYFETWVPIYKKNQGVGINDHKNSGNIDLYPDPVSQRLFLTNQNPEDVLIFRIYSSEGKLNQVIENRNISAGIPVQQLG